MAVIALLGTPDTDKHKDKYPQWSTGQGFHVVLRVPGRGFPLTEPSGGDRLTGGALEPGQGCQQLWAGAVLGTSRGGSCLLVGPKLGDPEVRLSKFKSGPGSRDFCFVLTA